MNERHGARLLKHHFDLFWWVLFVMFSTPMLVLSFSYCRDELGSNPLQTMTVFTGHAAIVCLALSLCLTPLRRFLAFICTLMRSTYGKRLSDWNSIIRFRRMIGLWAFIYAALHFWIWLELDIAWSWMDVKRASIEKPFVAAGEFSLAILSVLAMTSTNGAIRLLRRNWKRLHSLVYVAACAAVVHYFWLTKAGKFMLPAIYAVCFAGLLGYRIFSALGVVLPKARDDGDEVPERISPLSQ